MIIEDKIKELETQLKELRKQAHKMGSHELARELLSQPDLPLLVEVTIYSMGSSETGMMEADGWKPVSAVNNLESRIVLQLGEVIDET